MSAYYFNWLCAPCKIRSQVLTFEPIQSFINGKHFSMHRCLAENRNYSLCKVGLLKSYHIAYHCATVCKNVSLKRYCNEHFGDFQFLFLKTDTVQGFCLRMIVVHTTTGILSPFIFQHGCNSNKTSQEIKKAKTLLLT